MKTLGIYIIIVMALSSICAGTCYGTATGINIISQTHHVWGDAGWNEVLVDGVWHWYPDEEYNLTDTNPVSGTSHGWGLDGNYGMATSSAGDFKISAYRGADAGSATSRAESTYVFTPTTTALTLTISGSIGEWAFENQARFTLTDVTAGELLANYISEKYTSYPLKSGYAINWQQNYQVDPLHQYSLWMYVLAQRLEGGTGDAQLSAVLTPEPMSMLLLGLGGLLLHRRKK